MQSDFPRPGTGIVGFGCAAVLAVLMGLPVVLSFDASVPAFACLGALAVIVGLLAAHLGEVVHETLLKIAAWFR